MKRGGRGWGGVDEKEKEEKEKGKEGKEKGKRRRGQEMRRKRWIRRK